MGMIPDPEETEKKERVLFADKWMEDFYKAHIKCFIGIRPPKFKIYCREGFVILKCCECKKKAYW